MVEPKRLMEEKLREAAHLGDLKTIQDLLQSGVDINSKNNVNGWTALHWAAYRNHCEVVKYLLSFGADRVCLTSKGESPYNLTRSKEIQVLLEGVASEKIDQELLITPNYLRNQPLFISNVDSHSRTISTESNVESRISQPDTNFKQELVLKVRVARSLDPDFIEIEIPKSDLTIQRLKKICSEELNICSSSIAKIRKLPNTIIRNDKDVERLTDFQELEVVILKRTIEVLDT